MTKAPLPRMAGTTLGRIKVLLVALGLALAAESAYLVYHYRIEHKPNPFRVRVDLSAPQAEEIERVLRGLEYSGMVALTRQSVKLAIDPQERRWFLTNYYTYDDNKRLILEAGRFGNCGSLAASVYFRIKDLFDTQRYTLSAVIVSESRFFPSGDGTHVVLKIKDNEQNNPIKGTFILDPSFRRYQNVAAFEDYLFDREGPMPALAEQPSPDLAMDSSGNTPLLIRNDHLISLAVIEAEGQFDPEHFEILILQTKQYQYVDRLVMRLRVVDHTIYDVPVEVSPVRVLTKAETSFLRNRLYRLAQEVQLR